MFITFLESEHVSSIDFVCPLVHGKNKPTDHFISMATRRPMVWPTMRLQTTMGLYSSHAIHSISQFFSYFFVHLPWKKTHLNFCAIFLPAQQILLFSFGQTTPDNGNESTALQLAVPIVINITPSNAFLLTDTIVNISVTGGSATCESMISVSHNHSHVQLFTCCTCILSPAVGQDFSLSRTEVIFGMGANSGSSINILVQILDDTLVEGTENFTLTGSVAPPASFGSSITVSIIDDDGKCVCLCISISKPVNWILQYYLVCVGFTLVASLIYNIYFVCQLTRQV